MEKEITIEQIYKEVYSIPIPKHYREGQFVFNRVEELYGKVAREVQFKDGFDCFYDNSHIGKFIENVCHRLNK